MPKLHKVKGSTSVILEIFIQDSSSTTGAGLTGLVFNTGSLSCYYHRNTAAAAVAVSLVTMTVGTFTSSGFKEVDATNMPGVYQLCLPDAAYATGADSVSAILKGAANMAPVTLELQLTGVDFADAVRMGLTALPNAAAEAAGGLYTRGTGAGQINQDTNGRVDTNTKAWAGTATTLSSGVPDVNIKTITAGIIAAASFASGALDAVWSTAARLLTAGTNIVLAKGTGVTGFNDLDAAGVRGAVGLASANLDTQLGALGTAANQTTINNNVLTRATPAQVNAEVLDVLTVDTFAEPAGAPAATTTIKNKIGWLFKLARNLRTTTSAVDSVYNDAGAVVDSTAALSDDGTTFTRGEYT